MKRAHSDQKYIAALLNGDSVLIEEIYQKWGPEVRRFVIKNSGTAEDAKDIFQETIMAVINKVNKDGLILTVPFGGYIYFIYRALWFNKLSNNGKENVTINDLKRYSNEPATNQSEETNLLEQRLTLLKACFEKLSEKCQKLLNFKFKERLKAKEIMEMMEMPSEGAVNKKMFDCRRNLEKCMKSHPDFKDLNL